MQFGASGEIIFESRTEARVAADLLTSSNRTDLLESIVPPVEPPSIGWWELIKKIALERHGQVDPGTYTVSGNDVVADMAQTLMRASNLLVKTDKPGTKRDYMGSKITEFMKQVERVKIEADILRLAEESRFIEVGGNVLVGNISEEDEAVLRKRHEFSEAYMAARGWSLNNLSVEQLLEIRSQPEWQDPQQGAE